MFSRRPQAQRVSKPVARYRPGKAPIVPGGAPEYDSEDDDAYVAEAAHAGEGIVESEPVAHHKVDIHLLPQEQEDQVDQEDLSEYETDTEEEAEPVPFKPVFRGKGTGTGTLSSGSLPSAPANARLGVEASPEYETDSEEESSSSESDHAPPAPIFRPTFVSKAKRTTLEDEGDVAETDVAAEVKAKEDRAKRKQEAHDLAAARIKVGLLEAEAVAAEQNPELSDTDGRNPEEEFQAWRERELKRLSRTRQGEQEQAEREAEQERRMKMTQAERDAEDLAHANQTRKEKITSRPTVGFMQKYRHKGVFFQDMDILKRDYSGPTENEIDKSSLPQLMQVRDFGRKGRSKWTHLAAEDTTRQNQPDPRFRPRTREDRPLDHRREARVGPTSTGANSYSQRPIRSWGQGPSGPQSCSSEANQETGSTSGPASTSHNKEKGWHASNRLRMKDDDRPRRKAGDYHLDDDSDDRRRAAPSGSIGKEPLEYGSSFDHPGREGGDQLDRDYKVRGYDDRPRHESRWDDGHRGRYDNSFPGRERHWSDRQASPRNERSYDRPLPRDSHGDAAPDRKRRRTQYGDL